MTKPPTAESSYGVAAIQCALGGTTQENVEAVSHWVAEAAAGGADIVLPPELFETPYFPQQERESCFSLARPLADHPTLKRCCALAKQLKICLPVSLFEQAGTSYFNTVVMIDAAGDVQGHYRKSHIPTGPGYQEKFYFHPGNTGFRVWKTPKVCIGVGICWDQWFPESARAMVLQGANLLLYPTAIGSEPAEPNLNTCAPWQRAMQGHAVCNTVPIVAANRIGQEDAITFYGHSFACDERGEIVASLDADTSGIILARFDAATTVAERASFGLFRDRRPDLYGDLVAP